MGAEIVSSIYLFILFARIFLMWKEGIDEFQAIQALYFCSRLLSNRLMYGGPAKYMYIKHR